MRSHLRIVLVACVSVVLSGPATTGLAAGHGGQIPHILTLREQNTFYNASLKVRLEQIVPEIMREEGIDLWLVICRENNEDPVYSLARPVHHALREPAADPRLPRPRRRRLRALLGELPPDGRVVQERLGPVEDGPVGEAGRGHPGAEPEGHRHQRIRGGPVRRRPDRVAQGPTGQGHRPRVREAAEVGRARGRARPRAPDARRTDPLPADRGHRARDHRRGVLEPGDHAGRHDDRGRGVVDAPAVAPARVRQLVPAVGVDPAAEGQPVQGQPA